MSSKEYLKQTVGYLNSIGLDVFLHSSTLLQIVRNKEFRLRHKNDMEINLGCRAEDLTPEIISKIIEDNEFVIIRNSRFKNNHLIFFAPSFPEGANDMWGIKTGFTLLAPFYKEGLHRYEYMGDSRIKIWDCQHLDNKQEWEDIMYDGTPYKAPKDKIKWFENYFGGTWQTEDQEWHWSKDACNLANWQSLYKQKDFIKKGKLCP